MEIRSHPPATGGPDPDRIAFLPREALDSNRDCGLQTFGAAFVTNGTASVSVLRRRDPMNIPLPPDSSAAASSWIRRSSILFLLAALPLAGCDKSSAKKETGSQSSDDSDDESNPSMGDEGDDSSEPKDSSEEENTSKKDKEDTTKDSGDSGESGSGDGPGDKSGENDKTKSDSTDSEDKSDSDDKSSGDSSSKGSDDSSSSGTDDKKEKRDCEKVDWGSGTLKEGQIVPETKVKGFVDEDGDGRLEAKSAPAGMCELHLSDKRCGLIVYGAARKEGSS